MPDVPHTLAPLMPSSAPVAQQNIPFDAIPPEIKNCIYAFALRPALSPYYQHCEQTHDNPYERPILYLRRDMIQLRLCIGVALQTALDAYFINRQLIAHLSVIITKVGAPSYAEFATFAVRSGTFEEHPVFVKNVRKLKVRLHPHRNDTNKRVTREEARTRYVEKVKGMMRYPLLLDLVVDFDGIPEELQEGMFKEIKAEAESYQNLKVKAVRTKVDWGF